MYWFDRGTQFLDKITPQDQDFYFFKQILNQFVGIRKILSKESSIKICCKFRKRLMNILLVKSGMVKVVIGKSREVDDNVLCQKIDAEQLVKKSD